MWRHPGSQGVRWVGFVKCFGPTVVIGSGPTLLSRSALLLGDGRRRLAAAAVRLQQQQYGITRILSVGG
jgi:hypothetical protein